MPTKLLKPLCKAHLARRSSLFHLGRWLTRHEPKIFMLHRFAQQPPGLPGALPAACFERFLQLLARFRCRVLTLGEYVAEQVTRSAPPGNAVVLTVDDGYADFFEVAYPLLHRYGCPATFFVTSSFVLEGRWLWPDPVRYLLRTSPASSLTLNWAGQRLQLSLDGPADREAAIAGLMPLALRLRPRGRLALQGSLEAAAGLELPVRPPADYAPVSPEQLRRMADAGIEIGCHTVTHPLLARLEPATLEAEIELAKRQLEQALGRPQRSFCYPNGEPGDVTPAVVAAVVRAGFQGAVVYRGGECRDRYRLPRMGLQADQIDQLWKLAGWEQLGERWRQRRRLDIAGEARP